MGEIAVSGGWQAKAPAPQAACATVAWMLFGCYAAMAQDTRNVTEPAIPRSCVVLSANLTAVDG